MELARLKDAQGIFWALVRGERFLPVADAGGAAADDLCSLLNTGDFAAMAGEAETIDAWQSLEDASYLPPLSARSRILCVGKNYAAHAREMNMAEGAAAPAAPDIFVRFASSFAGHGGAIEAPEDESTFDFEGELAVVIGTGGRTIPESQALDHIFGVTTANDGSLRRTQKRTSQFTLGKNIDRSGALGPTIRPVGDIGDLQALRLKTFLNDQQMQDGTTADMIFSVARIIAFVSSTMALAPGDILLTGTPAGVGAARTPPRFLKAGDRLSVEIEGLRPLEVSVRATPGALL